jgi:hypothetical protein
VLAACAGACGALAVRDLFARDLLARGTRLARALAYLVEDVVTLGRVGGDPGAA